ncbi:unnamed protein product [Thelazia callipaeda]|uniref:S4 RNA-binding domain-containing protein n=1 Tax=Thelazia callipaeda TaxID=103827 RepID=A0A0N5CLH3_THECL|nr:unnamed protein product [Thelazia callipaeda]
MILLDSSRSLRLQLINSIAHVILGAQSSPILHAIRRRSKVENNLGITEDGLPKDYRLQVFKVGSRRLDTIISRAVGKGRGQAEKLILTNKVQVNEENVAKKSAYHIQENDVIDIWKQPVEDNMKFAEVQRIEIVNYTLTDSGYDVTLKSWKNFYVHNWRDK